MDDISKEYLRDIDTISILDDINIKYGQAKITGYLKSIFGKILFQNISFETTNPMEGIAFFKSESSHRTDHNKSFFNVYEIAGEQVALITTKSKNYFSLLRTIKKIVFLSKNIKKAFTKRKLLYVLARINSMLIIENFITSIKTLDISKLSLGVVYYDVSKYDYMFVKYLKRKGIETATLQHASFISPREISSPNFEFEGVELCNSTADIFLAWNPFTKEEALKSGMCEKKIEVLGIPKYINYSSESIDHKETHHFGVVLNAKSFDNLNKKLIQYADFVAEKTGYSYYLKYHPQFQEFVYDDLPKSGMCLGHLELSIPVSEYIHLVDFSLISNSTVFIELIYMGQTVFRMQAGEDDKFKNVPFNAFSNEDELNALLNKKFTNSKEQLFEYLCFTKTPEKNYKKFFECRRK